MVRMSSLATTRSIAPRRIMVRMSSLATTRSIAPQHIWPSLLPFSVPLCIVVRIPVVRRRTQQKNGGKCSHLTCRAEANATKKWREVLTSQPSIINLTLNQRIESLISYVFSKHFPFLCGSVSIRFFLA